MPKKKSAAKSLFSGRWHIISMTEWDEGYFNEEVQAYVDFEPDGLGSFQFGYVQGQIDTGRRRAEMDNQPWNFPGRAVTVQMARL